MKKVFLDLGTQPIANNFVYDSKSDNFRYNLKVSFDEDTNLVSLNEFVKPELMFNENYMYHSSGSETMRKHFSDLSKEIKKEFNPNLILEIGSNDGVFIKNFNKENSIAVEPCKNFSDLTNSLGHKTYQRFWNIETANLIFEDFKKVDVIFSANCLCHIQDLNDAFQSVSLILAPGGVFIFEDPSLINMIERGSYDQLYDEHAHIFSIIALNNILSNHDLEIFRVVKTTVHGGSNRIFVAKKGARTVEDSVELITTEEKALGLDRFDTFLNYSNRVEESKNNLLSLLYDLKEKGKKVISYGATSKSTTIFNYCKIGPDLIEYIIDTTLNKQGRLSPGMYIPVISPEYGMNNSVDYAFLGAWNFKNEILNKEQEFLKRGGSFITHVPKVSIVR